MKKQTITVAKYDSVIFEFKLDCFGFSHYIVQDAATDAYKIVSFCTNSTMQERQAYEKAARIYNSLVPDAECIPLF